MEDYNNMSSSSSLFRRFEFEDMNRNIFLPAPNVNYNSSSSNIVSPHRDLIMNSLKEYSLSSSSSSSWPNPALMIMTTSSSTAASTDFDQLQDDHDHHVVNESSPTRSKVDDDDQLVLLLQQQSSAAGNINNIKSNNNYSNQLQMMNSSSSTEYLSAGGGAAAAGGDVIINEKKKGGSSSSGRSAGGAGAAGAGAGAEKKVKKARYAFQTRSQVDILDDGYRWRKYGQKAVKNNKFPRSYYRCTHQSCNVKKQVQRLSKDDGVVVTTYEGIHTHAIERPTDNFDSILSQMQIYAKF